MPILIALLPFQGERYVLPLRDYPGCCPGLGAGCPFRAQTLPANGLTYVGTQLGNARPTRLVGTQLVNARPIRLVGTQLGNARPIRLVGTQLVNARPIRLVGTQLGLVRPERATFA